MIPQSVDRRLTNLLVLTGPATTLAISPWFSFDPINPIKILVLSCFAFAAFGLLVPYIKEITKRTDRNLRSVLMLFVLAMFSSFFLSTADKGQQFWGVFGRNTGLFTYLSLVTILFVASSLSQLNSYRRVISGLIITTSIMVLYCLVQIAKLDPVNWSAFFPFGTLGNVNFLSGFLGVALVTVFIVLVSKFAERAHFLGLLVVFTLGIFALYKSDSTQGVVALAVGISTFLLIKAFFFKKIIFGVGLVFYSGGFISLALGLVDKGPLRELIYQFTVLYRADYMHAAYKMLLDNPWAGVGIDSYDDWYRSERGLISAFRTSFNRTANSAHNISLDLAAGGGFPLLIAYLAILVLVIVAVIYGLRNGLHQDPTFMALSMSWLAYQVQASVSINQVGVGVWGWILAGSVIGYSRLNGIGNVRTTATSKFELDKKARLKEIKSGAPNTPPAKAVLASATLLATAFVFSFLPLKTDADFFSATKIGSAEKFLELTSRPTANTFMLARAAAGAVQAGLNEPAKVIIDRLSKRFPRNTYGQLIKIEGSFFSESEKTNALKQLRSIDPYLAICYSVEPSLEFSNLLASLPAHEAYRLARGWGLTNKEGVESPTSFSWSQVDQEALRAKLSSFCMP